MDLEMLPLTAAQRVDECCQRFEAAWGRHADDPAQPVPAIEGFLAGTAEPERSALARELIRLEVYYARRCHARCPTPGEYQERFPWLPPEWLVDTLPPDEAVAPGAVEEQSVPALPGYEVIRELGRGGM